MSSNSKRREEQIKNKYKQMAKEATPKSEIFKNCLKAFLVGGIICDIGQLIMNIIESFGYPKEQVMNIVPIILVYMVKWLVLVVLVL